MVASDLDKNSKNIDPYSFLNNFRSYGVFYSNRRFFVLLLLFKICVDIETKTDFDIHNYR